MYKLSMHALYVWPKREFENLIIMYYFNSMHVHIGYFTIHREAAGEKKAKLRIRKDARKTRASAESL
jgi:hypothetical protein